ncbi:uncharacterized protein METZ01_LOCUS130818, partial [marine metagenome]
MAHRLTGTQIFIASDKHGQAIGF